jgi:hypothetical protein
MNGVLSSMNDRFALYHGSMSQRADDSCLPAQVKSEREFENE